MSNKDNQRQNDAAQGIRAYDRVVARLHKNLADAEAKSWDYLQEKIEEAVELELTAEEMTRDEMDLLSAYIKRDMKKLGFYAHETGEGIAAWLHFDLNILESRLKKLFMDLADKTRIEQEELRERLDHAEDHYMAGELAGAGTLECLACHQHQVLTATAQIEACDGCGARYFQRVSKPWEGENGAGETSV